MFGEMGCWKNGGKIGQGTPRLSIGRLLTIHGFVGRSTHHSKVYPRAPTPRRSCLRIHISKSQSTSRSPPRCQSRQERPQHRNDQPTAAINAPGAPLADQKERHRAMLCLVIKYMQVPHNLVPIPSPTPRRAT